ncbi:leucine-rich repeat domain-containing protein, partial [Faecalicatena contorta]|uniref:leucine-rich repeat domain-containing protein n=1 Tax=Faecalicatena contorta TaxID=39482 RepID=UPI001F2D0A65
STVNGITVTRISLWIRNEIESITIPDTVTYIGDFKNGGGGWEPCSSLESITVDENNPNYCSVEGVLFNKDQTSLVCCPTKREGEYRIPDSVTTIEKSAFKDCIALTNVIIPEGVTTIKEYAFSNCDSITAINIPSTVINIEGDTQGLSSVYRGFVKDCDNLSQINVSEDNEYYSSDNG